MPTASANIFAKCLPALSTNIDRCGSLTVCDALTAQSGDLINIFSSDGQFRLMGSLLSGDIMVKACGMRQHGLYDFWMANSRDMTKHIKPERMNSKRIEPFILVERQSVVNRETWGVVASNSTGANSAEFHLISRNGFPNDARFFKTGGHLYIQGVSAGGSLSATSWKITSAAVSTSGGNATVLVQTTGENSNSFLPAAKLERPSTGIAEIGPNNVDDFEKWCNQDPGINNIQSFPSWLATRRRTYESCSAVREFEDLVMNDNPYYKKYLYVPEVVQNRVNGEQFMRERVRSWFWGKALPNQTLAAYRSLDNITAWSTDDLYTEGEGICVGKRAEPIGIYEQLGECGSVKDLQGGVLNLEELFIDLKLISRARKDQGGNSDSWKNIDILTDSTTARQINKGMTLLYKLESADSLSYQIQMGQSKNGGSNPHFGFYFTSWPLPNYPSARFNIIVDDTMDDMVSAGATESAAIGNAVRRLWVLDFAGMYPAIVATNKVVSTVGKQSDLAKVNQDAACVMRTNERTVTQDSVTETFVVECPANSRIYENFSSDVPEHEGVSGTTTDIYGSY